MRAKARAIVVISAMAGLLWHAAAPISLAAQGSLADVAKQEQERRKNIKAPSKVLTNQDLKPAPAVSPGAAAPADAAGAASADGGKTAPAPAEGGKGDNGDKKEAPKDQAYWSKRLADLQSGLTRNESFAVALQSRINALANEYTNQGDGVQQHAIAAERQKALADLDRLNKEILDNKKAIADLQEEARSSGVPPGWLR
jgi:hypothetical protein